MSVAKDLDYASAPELLMKLHPLIEVDAPPVVAVLDGIDFVDSSGLGVLLWAHRRADSVGSAFLIAAPSNVVSRRLARMGLDRHFSVVDAPPRADGDEQPPD